MSNSIIFRVIHGIVFTFFENGIFKNVGKSLKNLEIQKNQWIHSTQKWNTFSNLLIIFWDYFYEKSIFLASSIQLIFFFFRISLLQEVLKILIKLVFLKSIFKFYDKSLYINLSVYNWNFVQMVSE